MRARSSVQRRAEPTGTHTDVQHVSAGAPAASPATLRVGAHDDPAEAQADRLAAQALAVAADYQAGDRSITVSDEAGARAPAIRRRASRANGPTTVDEAAVRGAARGGRTLDPAVRASMEPAFGHDLGGVRVHTGPAADRVARSIDAAAFTHGQDVFFAAGAYRPGTPGGDHVIAHELAHTVQHRRGDDVQRYPATAMSLPVPWSHQTGRVFRPGEGLSGGVYILTTNVAGDPVRKAVAKPLFGQNAAGARESGEQLVASDRIMGKLFGLNAPQSRVVKKGSAEFDELVRTCAPYQPRPKPQDPEDALVPEVFVPLAEAEAFVVMSEVPNATSVSSLSDKAARGDRRAKADLYRTMFDETFLANLGKLAISDMLVGNADRMAFGAMNLGNVMLSMQDGRGELHAIDTAAFLPKIVDPHKIAHGGNTGGDTSITVAKHLDESPGALLDGFFGVLIDRLKSNARPVPPGVTPAWQSIATTYRTQRDRWVGAFEYGWNDAMITVLQLADPSSKGLIEDAIGDAADDNVSPFALQVNAQYIGGRVMGSASHEEGVARPLGMALADQARRVDKDALVPPIDDELRPRFDRPDKKALQAEWSPIGALPPLTQLEDTVTDYPRLPQSGLRAVGRYPAAIAAAHAQVDQAPGATTTKRKFLVRKQTVATSSAQLGHAVVDAHAVIAGNGRVTHHLNHIRYEAEGFLQNVAIAKFNGPELASVRSLLDFYAVAADHLAVDVERYATAIGKVSSALPSMNYPDRKRLATIAGDAQERVKKSRAFYDVIRKLKLQQVSAGLKATA